MRRGLDNVAGPGLHVGRPFLESLDLDDLPWQAEVRENSFPFVESEAAARIDDFFDTKSHRAVPQDGGRKTLPHDLSSTIRPIRGAVARVMNVTAPSG